MEYIYSIIFVIGMGIIIKGGLSSSKATKKHKRNDYVLTRFYEPKG